MAMISALSKRHRAASIPGAMRRVLVSARATAHALAAFAATTLASVATAQASQPTMQDLSVAIETVDYSAVQLRRFRDTTHGVVTTRERVDVDANGTARPAFAITFLGVEGQLPGSPLHLQWQQTYSRFGDLFFSHGTFRVRDLARATQNYAIYDFGGVTRAGRTAQRLVVFPSRLDKSMWVVDVDTQTRVPLYTAEFDAQLTVISELEMLTFSVGVGPMPTAQPSSLHPNFQAARSAMGNPAEMIDPVITAADEYGIERVEVHTDPVNGRSKLMMTYTDGVDQFVVVQSPGTSDFLGALPGTGRRGKAIARYRDPAMSALLFWEGGVSFHVAGRGTMRRLDDVARRLFAQAIATH